ncbi:MAG: hypothetical protein NTZ10_06455, partial [Candidatus Saganbacteria bacterium]|nr:hypothetical protein [Candidatus Saganbacteria bacterium]
MKEDSFVKKGKVFTYNTKHGYLGSSQSENTLKPAEKQALEALAKRDGAGTDAGTEYTVNKRYLGGYTIQKDGKSISIKPANLINNPNTVLEGGNLVYKNVQRQTDVIYVPGPEGFEEVYLIKKDSGQRIIREIKSSTGKAAVGEKGQISICGMTLTSPVIFDAKGKRVEGRFEKVKGQDNRFEISFNKTGLEYPILIDPTWRSANSLSTARYYHSATLLPNGKVLVAGGTGAGASCEIFDPATGAWTSTGNLTFSRGDHTATLLPNGKVLAAGGWGYGVGHVLSFCEVYDPATGAWASTGGLNTARYVHTTTLLPNGKVLVTGGSTGSSMISSCELYDPTTESWSITGNLGTARDEHTATLLSNGKVLVAGGNNGGTLFSCEVYDPAAGTWSGTGSLITARFRFSATFLPNGKVLAAGGLTDSVYLTSCEVYDQSTGTWSSTGTLSVARSGHSATLLPDGKVLVTGGQTTGAGRLSSCELFDPALGTWSSAGSLSAARTDHTATLLPNGKVFIVAGLDVGILNSCEFYDPALGTWAGTGNLASGREIHAATLLPNGQVLVMGGYSGSYKSSCELYTPTLETWAGTGGMANTRGYFTATLLANGKVLVAGGLNTVAGFLNSCELYDPSKGTWAGTGNLGTARYNHTATLLANGKVLVAGGINTNKLTSCEVYDPSTGLWTSTGSLGTARYNHTATLLPSGKVLVAGGVTTLTSCEVYDPTAGTWAGTGVLGTGRQSHTATLLTNGKVLVAGGDNGAIPSYISCELYDPTAGTWAGTGPLSTGRVNHTATLLPDGKVLVAGGYDGGSFFTSCEVYDPSTATWTSAGSLGTARYNHTATLLTNGKVLMEGGAGSDFYASCELARYTEYDYTAYSNMQPVISTVGGSSAFPVRVAPNAAYTITGTGFKGISESSGGSYLTSPTNYPRLYLQFADSGGNSFQGPSGNLLDKTETVYPMISSKWQNADTSISFTTPSDLPEGYYLLTVNANAVPSDSKLVYYSTSSGSNTKTVTTEVIGSNGTIDAYGTVEVASGSVNTFTVTANTGYYIRDVKIDNISTTDALSTSYAYTFEAVTTDHTIQASFEVSGIRVWDGGSTTSCSWNDPLNWTGNTTPDASTSASFDATSTKVCTIGADATVKDIYITAVYTGNISQEANLTINGTYEQTGTARFICVSPDTPRTFTCESFSIPDTAGTFMRFTGAGTDAVPYMIYDVFGLQAMKQYLNDSNINFKLNGTIEASVTSNWNSGQGWIPVGNDPNYFQGKFNGNNKTINGLYINSPSTNNVGLFGNCSGEAVIQDVGMTGVSVTGQEYTGALAGYITLSTISNSYIMGNVTATSTNNGGLVGIAFSSSINNCYMTGSMTGAGMRTGGLVGTSSNSIISNCYATGSVSGSTIVGGLVGLAMSSAQTLNCYSTGQITCTGLYVGGLVGESMATISNSYATQNVGEGTYHGGLTGRDFGTTIESSYYCGSPNNGIGTQVTPAQLKQKSTFSGWDFRNTWLIDENKNYPYHTWEAWNTYPGSWTTLNSWKKNLIVQSDYPRTNNDKVFISTGDASVTVPSVPALGGLHLGTGAGTVTLGGDLTLDNAGTREGSLAIYGGTLTTESYTISIDGNFTHSGGTFVQTSGTISFESTTPSSIEGNTTFHNFKCVIPNKPLTFEAGSITTIDATGAFTLTGTSGNRISLRSSSSPATWEIDPIGTRSVSYVDVKDSNNISTEVINPTNSLNSGNTTNWFTACTITSEVIGAGNGTIDPSGVAAVEYGTSKTYVVSANTGYYIRDVKIDNISTTDALSTSYAYTFEAVTTDHTIQASFEVSGIRVWDGGGTTRNWRDPLNWTGNTTPEITAIVTFDATNTKVCTIDAGTGSVESIYITTGYTGNISQEANLTIYGTYEQAGTARFICADPSNKTFT